MSALDAMTAHTVVSELGPLVAREQLSHGTRFPRTAQRLRSTGPSVWARTVRMVKRYLEIHALMGQVAHLPPHMLRDIGLDPENVPLSISQRVNQLDAVQVKTRLVA